MGSGGAVATAQEGPPPADGPDRQQARRVATRLERAQRLRRTSDIHRVLQIGRRLRMKHLELIWTPSLAGSPRMGLIVPKFRNTGVARNRLRRRLREIWRIDVQDQQGSRDLLIRARPGAYEASFPDLRADLLGWLDAVRTAQ